VRRRLRRCSLGFHLDALPKIIISGRGFGSGFFRACPSSPRTTCGCLAIRRRLWPLLLLERLGCDGRFGRRVGVGTPASANRPAGRRAAGFRAFGGIEGTFRSHAVYFRKTKMGDRQGARRPRVGPSRREWRASLATARKRNTSRAKRSKFDALTGTGRKTTTVPPLTAVPAEVESATITRATTDFLRRGDHQHNQFVGGPESSANEGAGIKTRRISPQTSAQRPSRTKNGGNLHRTPEKRADRREGPWRGAAC
jgi:hypothetical protein